MTNKKSDNLKISLNEEMTNFFKKYPTIDSSSVILCKKEAESGNPEAMKWLARMYRDGKGVETDLDKAAEWMRKAANEGVSWARSELYDIFWKMDTPDSLKEMRELVVPLAKSGDARAMNQLARMYRDGKGVETDLDKAAEWMRKAANEGVSWAPHELFGILWQINTPDSLKEMIEVITPLAKSGDARAKSQLARAYHEGKGVEKAAEWENPHSDTHLINIESNKSKFSTENEKKETTKNSTFSSNIIIKKEPINENTDKFDLNQSITKGKLNLDGIVKLTSEENSYKLYCNGEFVKDLLIKKSTHSEILPKKGRYNIQLRSKIDGKITIKNYDYIDHIDLDVDVCVSNLTRNMVENVGVSIRNDLTYKDIVSDNIILNEECILIIDFESLIEKFIDKNKNNLNAYQAEINYDTISKLRRKDKKLMYFLNKTGDLLNEASKKYGHGNVVVVLHDHKDKNFIWMNEEIYSLILRIPGIIGVKNNETNCDEFVNVIKHIGIQKYISYPEIKNIDMQLKNDTLSVFCNVKSIGENWYRVDLFKNGKRIDTKNKSKDDRFLWRINEPGIYFVTVHVSYVGLRTRASSRSIEYYNAEFEESYRQFLLEPIECGSPIPFRSNKYPYSDFLLVSTTKSKQEDPINLLKSGFKCITLKSFCDYNNFLYTNDMDNDDETIFFSGIITSAKEYVVGQKELKGKKIDIVDNLGSYSYVLNENSGIIAGRDFFNMCKLYYYQKEGLFLISNSYHLLLIALVNLNENLNFNLKKVFSTLSIPGTQILAQNFSSEMEILGVKMLQPYYNIQLNKNGWILKKNNMYKILESKEPFHANVYGHLLDEACMEIKNNVTHICDASPHVIVDLTGGMDSRIIYGAITKTDNLSINSNKGNGNAEVEIASMVNRVKNIPFDTSLDAIRMITLNEADAWMRSHCMEQTYEFVLDASYIYPENRTSIIGAFGEVLTRPEYSKHCFEIPCEDITLNSILELYLSKIKHNMITKEDAFDSLKQFILKELQDYPTGSQYEKLETHYLSFRHSLHFDVVKENNRNNLVVMPMQSTSLFKAHHISLDHFKDMRLAFDLLGKLDPKLLSFPYEHENYNQEYERLKNNLKIYENAKSYSQLDIDLKPWIDAQEIKNKKRIAFKKDNNITIQNEDLDSFIIKNIKSNLHELLLLFPQLEVEIGRPLFLYTQYIHDDKNLRKLKVLYNKITSVLDQGRLIKLATPQKSL